MAFAGKPFRFELSNMNGVFQEHSTTHSHFGSSTKDGNPARQKSSRIVVDFLAFFTKRPVFNNIRNIFKNSSKWECLNAFETHHPTLEASQQYKLVMYRIFASAEYPHTIWHPHPKNCKEEKCECGCQKNNSKHIKKLEKTEE